MEPILSPALASHLQALVREPTTAALDAAQAKLERRLVEARPRRVRAARWIGAFATVATACLVLALVLMPTSRGVAFDLALKHLRDFRTLSMTIEQQSQGIAMPTIRVRMDRAGNARTDIGEATSVVVNAAEHRVLTLLHGPRMAMLLTLPADAKPKSDAALKWLDAIRQFQGKAVELPGQRIVDGRITHGWQLDVQGMRIALWADDEGVPRAVKVGGNGMAMSQRIHVTVDPPLDAAIFSTAIPAGYHEAQPDRD
ncbi:hypothetical protein [Dyella lutea]|uniref:Uncharacterized protein n=1 Tax=Dyella lutea TaxID=2950441 RepID=A0ABT1F913_9GAMM|nr:hypothetical protein [Dyella lutea]MCP1373871.1 hypothetical protein [Dyella lutea]